MTSPESSSGPVPAEVRLPLGSRTRWVWFGLAMTGFGAAELAVSTLVIRALTSAPWSTLLEAVLAIATAGVLIAVWSPVAADLRIGDQRVVVTFGIIGQFTVDLDQIATVAEYRPDPAHPVLLGIDAGATVARTTFSRGAGAGYVLISTRTPQQVRSQILRRSETSTVVLRLDEPQRAVGEIRDAMRRRDPPRPDGR
jgi:hypothetical protein